MRGLVALLCVGTAHALGETCSTLWSKLAHLGCRPQDQPLRDHLDTLTLADDSTFLDARRAAARLLLLIGRDLVLRAAAEI